MSVADCPVCGAELERRPTVAEAERGTVRSLVEGAPVLACPSGHVERAPVPGVDAEVLADVRDRLLVAARPRLPWRAQRCGACGQALTMPGRRTTRSVTVTSTDGPPFTVTLDLPMLRCTECVGDNLPRSSWADVEAATRAALRGS